MTQDKDWSFMLSNDNYENAENIEKLRQLLVGDFKKFREFERTIGEDLDKELDRCDWFEKQISKRFGVEE